MNPAWASCYGDIRGVYDPPIALTQVASVKAPQMTGSVPAKSEVIGATPASIPAHPAAETGAAAALPDNLPSNGVVGGSVPQASHLHESTPDIALGGVVANILGDSGSSDEVDLSSLSHASQTDVGNGTPSNSVGEILPQAPRPSGPNQDVGGVVASILGGAGLSMEGNSLPSNSPSQTGVAAVPPDDLLPGNAAGLGGPGISQLLEASQGIGGIVASILRDAGHSTGTDDSTSRHAFQDVAGNGQDPSPTPTSASDNWSHQPSDLMAGSGQADQIVSGGVDVASSRSASTLGADDSGASTGLLSDVSAANSDNGRGTTKSTSTQASTRTTEGPSSGAGDSSSGISASAQNAESSSSSSITHSLSSACLMMAIFFSLISLTAV
jgi:hypothetical protein